MNWKKPIQNIFFVPFPDNGQSRAELIRHRITPGAEPLKLTFTDPYTKEDYTAEIIDYFGPYPADKLPDTFSIAATDKPIITGTLLIDLLRRRQPKEFKTVKDIFFYQLNKL